MVATIGNPLSWGVKQMGAAGRGVRHAAEHAGGDGEMALPTIRRIGMSDLRAALKMGFADFVAMRSDVLMACLLYPVIGVCLGWFAGHRGMMPVIFPLVSGFALVGPVAGLGLYELSRRREAGDEPGWSDMFKVVAAPGFGAVLMMAIALAVLFVVWVVAAWLLFLLTVGGDYPTVGAFAAAVLGTTGGWVMMLVGIPLGFLFALAALVSSSVTFPLLLDRDIGLPRAVATSVALFRANPATMLIWGLIIVLGLVIGSIPLLLGLAVSLPVLGHATWHLYRRSVE